MPEYRRAQQVHEEVFLTQAIRAHREQSSTRSDP